jgi:hypothetical protein
MYTRFVDDFPEHVMRILKVIKENEGVLDRKGDRVQKKSGVEIERTNKSGSG